MKIVSKEYVERRKYWAPMTLVILRSAVGEGNPGQYAAGTTTACQRLVARGLAEWPPKPEPEPKKRRKRKAAVAPDRTASDPAPVDRQASE
jgi:hypothetical protein